jgi:hypothetical protein
LHLANVPWFVLGAAVFVLSFPAKSLPRKIGAFLVLFCPFAWYYLDEARPYGMQLGAGLLIVGSLRRLLDSASLDETDSRLALGGFLTGVAVLSGSSLLGMIWAAAALGAAALLLSRTQIVNLFKRHWNMLLIAIGPLALLAVYYLWTLKVGARASAAATTTIGSICFAAYELTGFTGLGPGRLEMRSAAGPGALRGYLPGLGLYGLAAALVIGAAAISLLRSRNRRQLALVLCCAAPLAFILAVGFVAHFRVLGRHLAPFVPIWLLLLTLGLTALWAGKNVAGRGLLVAFCALSIASCLLIRFAARHEKDNYRVAAEMARSALKTGSPVWWNAAEEGARYYNVPVSGQPEATSSALFLMNPTRQSLEALPPPRVIVASKADVYDTEAALTRYVHDHGYSPTAKLTAFVIWEKNPK